MSGRALSFHAGLGSGTVLQCLYRLENLGWLESRGGLRLGDVRWPATAAAVLHADGVGQREERALVAERFKGAAAIRAGGRCG